MSEANCRASPSESSVCLSVRLFSSFFFFFFLHDPPPPDFSPLPHHAPLPISPAISGGPNDTSCLPPSTLLLSHRRCLVVLSLFRLLQRHLRQLRLRALFTQAPRFKWAGIMWS